MRVGACTCTCYTKVSANRVWASLESEGILASRHKFKGLFEGLDMVLRVRSELGLG